MTWTAISDSTVHAISLGMRLFRPGRKRIKTNDDLRMCRSLFSEHSSGFEDAGSKGSIGRVRSLSGGGLQSPVRAFATQSLRGATTTVPAGGGEWHGAGHRRVRSPGTPRAGAGLNGRGD